MHYILQVVDFFEGPLGLITSQDISYNDINCGVTRQDLMKIPILAVGLEVLNDIIHSDGDRIPGGYAHSRSCGTTARLGLCLSDRIGRHDGGSRNGVTSILCLSGLPSDLTASILAHGMFSTEYDNALLLRWHSLFSLRIIFLPKSKQRHCTRGLNYIQISHTPIPFHSGWRRG